MLEELFGKAPEMADRCGDFSAGRGLDNAPQKARLWDKWTIRPLIDTRLMWQAEKKDPGYDPDRPITRALFPDRADVVVHDERGRVSCICPETGEERAMAFQGFEASRGFCGTLKYRCPAAAFGFECAGRDACHRAGGVEPGEYGRIVRIDLDSHDRRIFTPTPWGSPSWRRGYRRRSAMERINSRIDQGFGFETHYIRGLAKMKACIGLALAVMMALALGQVRAPATPSGCARWSAWCRCATPAGASSAFRHRGSTRPAAGRRNPAATLATVFPHCSDLAWNRRILLARQDQADDIRPHPTGNARQKNATAHMPRNSPALPEWAD